MAGLAGAKERHRADFKKIVGDCKIGKALFDPPPNGRKGE
jgi:hypothetical protein